MKQPTPAGLVADVRVAVNTEDDSRQFNKVTGFKVLEQGPAPSTLQPDADELGEDDEEDGVEDDEDEDTRDADDFDWASGEQRDRPQ